MWNLLIVILSFPYVSSINLKGKDLFYEPTISSAPRALLVDKNDKAVKSVATVAFSICLFSYQEYYEGLASVALFSFASRERKKVEEIALMIDYNSERMVLSIHETQAYFSVVPHLNEWTHICVSWESKTGNANLYLNGTRYGLTSKLQESYEIGGDGYLILLGQYKYYQVDIGADFNPDGGDHRRLTQFNLWSRILSEKEVIQSYNCMLEGNVVSWSKSNWLLFDEIKYQPSQSPCSEDPQPGSSTCECNSFSLDTLRNTVLSTKTEIQVQVAEVKQSLISFGTDVLDLKQKSEEHARELKRNQQLKEECRHEIDSLKKGHQDAMTQLSSMSQSINSQMQSLLAELKSVKAKLSCADNFVRFNDRCYFFSKEGKTWDEALAYCPQLQPQSALVSFETAEEWEMIKNYIRMNYGTETAVWISASDRQQEGTWKWMGSNQPIHFNAWCPGEPNNSFDGENCAIVQPPNTCWNDALCPLPQGGNSLYFICEYRMT